MTSNHAPAPVGATITGHAHFGGEAQLVFTWIPADPHAVGLVIHYAEEEPVEWVIGRDLFIDYYGRGEAGDTDGGDFRIYTDDGEPDRQDVSTIHLSSPFGEAWIEVPQQRLRAFARQMKDIAKRYEAVDTAVVGAQLDTYLTELCGVA